MTMSDRSLVGSTSRLRAPAVMLLGGTAITGASATAGVPTSILAALAAVTAAATILLWSIGGSATDAGRIVRSAADVRRGGIDLRAGATAGLVLCATCLAAGVVAIARGGTGAPWTTLCAVFTIAYAMVLLVTGKRRAG